MLERAPTPFSTLLCLSLWSLVYCSSAPPSPSPAYRAEIETWRTERVDALTAPDGWLALAGLFWLDEGLHTFGSAPHHDLVFPSPAPTRLGAFQLEGDSLWIEIDEEVTVWDQDSSRVRRQALTEQEGEQVFHWGDFSWYPIERGGQYGIRLKNAAHPNLTQFEGLDYYPIDPTWKVEARLHPVDPPDTVIVKNVVDMEIPMATEGKLVFEREGSTHALTVLDGGEDAFFLIFMDATSGEETYPAGRYLYVPRPGADGITTIDFNKAYNPPCAFTDFATCLLPLPGNRLDLAIRAGEKDYGQH